MYLDDWNLLKIVLLFFFVFVFLSLPGVVYKIGMILELPVTDSRWEKG